MMKLILSDVIAKIQDLPSLPIVVLELMRNLNDDASDTNRLAAKIAQDQALSAKVLRLANSSFYGMQRKVGTIQQAITILGFTSVRALVTASAVISRYQQSKDSPLDFPAFWRHSIGTALCAKTLAKKLSLNQDHAFLTGLLHDIGRLVLVTYSASHYQAVIAYRTEHDCYLFEAERAVLDLDHTMVGRAIMEHWKFPPLILDAVEHHHFLAGENIMGLIAIVNLADCIAHGLDLSADAADLVPPLSASGWRKLNISETDLMDVFRETERQFEEACSILIE
ncbi:MAG: signal transduction protein [Herbaspirillum sp.]|jgi:putative nucleotidyltransferase with HDIG domain|nr:signal transduction protein [Herbaspirillum sp.]